MNFISIIVAGEKSARTQTIQEILQEHEINPFDVTEVAKGNIATAKTKAIGIEDVRNLQEPLYLAPLKGKVKALILSIDTITTEAQNALLKILEEPPQNTIIILSIGSSRNLLPTIVSRCRLITAKESTQPIEHTDFFTIVQAPMGEKLQKAQTLGKDKEGALSYLLQTITYIRKELYEEVLEKQRNTLKLQMYQEILSKLQSTYTAIATTNVSPRFALEILFLSMQR